MATPPKDIPIISGDYSWMEERAMAALLAEKTARTESLACLRQEGWTKRALLYAMPESQKLEHVGTPDATALDRFHEVKTLPMPRSDLARAVRFTELYGSGAPTTSSAVASSADEGFSLRKLEVLLAHIDGYKPPPAPPQLRLVPSHVWRTYGMWSPGITSADRWAMFCRGVATVERLEPNPTHDAMPSTYLKLPLSDYLDEADVILCRGERAYDDAVKACKAGLHPMMGSRKS